MVHVCSHKDLFNSLIVKEEGTVKMANDPVCKIISTGQLMLKEEMRQCMRWRRSGISQRHDINLISIGVLDEERCWI